ncbi:MAG: DNA gyrase inhibitor YacG [Nitrospirota bacterium]|nr:DNA gyrase inhibitor YacG [Nitrospirota bacterium]
MGKSTNKCPTCCKVISWEGNAFRPFCSKRCQMIDLQGWFGERYCIPQDEEADPDDAVT